MEVGILRSLRHKNIVSYLGTSMQQGTVYIFMEFISGGSLQSILKRLVGEKGKVSRREEVVGKRRWGEVVGKRKWGEVVGRIGKW